MSLQKPLVLFDIGAVLLRLNYGSFYETAAREYAPVPDLRSRYPALELQELRGEIMPDEFARRVNDLVSPDKVLSRSSIENLVATCWGAPIRKMLALKRRVHERGYPVGLLSNIGAFGHQVLSHKHPSIFDVFDARNPRVYSFQERAVKPDLAIYTAVPAIYRPIIFIDDKKSYVREPATSLGWRGIHYVEHLDHHEAIKSFAGHTSHVGVSDGDVRVAHSRDEVVAALADFGVKL